MAEESLGFKLGRWWGGLTTRAKFMLFVGGIVVLVLVLNDNGGEVSNTGNQPAASPAQDPGSSLSSCSVLSQTDINRAVSAWTGSGSFTVTAARKAASNGSTMFSEVWFIKGSAPGIPSEVFVFATESGGLLVGADSVTREFFEWGAAAASNSPAAQEARSTVNAAPTCLSP